MHRHGDPQKFSLGPPISFGTARTWNLIIRSFNDALGFSTLTGSCGELDEGIRYAGGALERLRHGSCARVSCSDGPPHFI